MVLYFLGYCLWSRCYFAPAFAADKGVLLEGRPTDQQKDLTSPEGEG